jgi:prepilin-type N-terminal cleavage/methylation domain-containing protein
MRVCHCLSAIPSTDSRRSAFTLLETVVALAILGILTVLTVSRYSSGQTDARIEADVVKSHLRYAQALAAAYNTSQWSVIFTPVAYSLRQNGNVSPIPIPGTSSPTHVLPTGVRITSGTGTLTFDSSGSPGNTDYTIQLNGLFNVLVTRQTGFVP